MNNFALKLIGIVVLTASIAGAWFWQSIDSFSKTPLNLPQQSMDFSIKSGASLTAVAYQLEKQQVISSADDFLWMIRLQGLSDSIQSGEYQLLSGMTPVELLALFASGKVKQYAFTIVEGWNVYQLLKALKQNPHIKWTLENKSPDEIRDIIGINESYIEGQFLPDTYHFPAQTTDVDFLKRAHSALKKELDSQWETRSSDVIVKSPHEALILASIVEKETGVASERSKIAGVFSRRLEKNMRLQTDPTVIYGLGENFDGNLTKAHLRDSSNPFNTYRIKGLPPSPIALPGADAIKAALHPEAGEELYFVAKGDGSHYFSSTVEEHNKAVRKFQINQRKTNYRSAPQTKEPG